MKENIQLEHPSGKKAITMDAGKYGVMKDAILRRLEKGGSTHTEMLRSITEDLTSKGVTFPGSIQWHMEWVKLDLESKKQIRRTDSTPARFDLVN